MADEISGGLILNKEDYEKFFASLAKKYHIFGPSQTNSGESIVAIDSPNKIKFDYINTVLSLKSFFFPQVEDFFIFDTEKNEVKHPNTETEVQNKHKILFGIKPCDAMSVSLLDRVFKENDPPDPYYTRRRNSTRIVSFACANPDSTCFCTSVGCGPDSETGTDIIFFELDGRYLIKPVTPEGREILEDVKDLLMSVTNKDIVEKARLMLSAKCKIEKIFEINDLKKKLNNFNASSWDKLYQKCLGCGICTYLCPTCHCFDITDEAIKPKGRRVRTWDSCMFSLFTLHASGHNPRPTQKERVRQRIMHKFNYTLKNYGQSFCVGCGRCITRCPVNMDIRQLIKGIMEEK